MTPKLSITNINWTYILLCIFVSSGIFGVIKFRKNQRLKKPAQNTVNDISLPSLTSTTFPLRLYRKPNIKTEEKFSQTDNIELYSQTNKKNYQESLILHKTQLCKRRSLLW